VRGRILVVVKVAKADADEAEALMRVEDDRFAQWQAIFVSSSQEEGGEPGVWLRVRILNSLVFSFSATVRAIRGR
jgi:hypothetical protein